MGRELMAPRTDRTTRIPTGVVPSYYQPCSERVRVCQLKKCRQLKNWPNKLFEALGELLRLLARVLAPRLDRRVPTGNLYIDILF